MNEEKQKDFLHMIGMMYLAEQVKTDAFQYLVFFALDAGYISASRAGELLGFQYMEDLRDWYNTFVDPAEKRTI